MKGRLILVTSAAILGIFALPRCSSCWDDPDDPRVWVKKLHEAKTKADREQALFNLYRIYEVDKAMMERNKSYAKKLVAFRKLVNPELVKVFKKKIKDRYVIPTQIVEKLVIFEANIPEAADLFISIIDKYTIGEAEEFGDEDMQETLAGKAVDGLGQMASRGHMPTKALDSVAKMIDQICRKRGSGKGVEGLDPRSFVRNAVVKSVVHFLKTKGTRSTLARILSKIVAYGQVPKSGQDPMVTIFGIRLLGDVGDISDETTKALVLSLLGKGRGRRFYSFAATAVAKLPLDGAGKHPAVEPLLLMLEGDPWLHKILDLKSKIRTEEARKQSRQQRIKDLKAELDPFEKQYKEKKNMLKCPFKAKYRYVCELFWQANIEDWAKTEPGVIPMNAMMVLREIGDTSEKVVDTMLSRYGVNVVRKRWLEQALSMTGMEEKKDRELPGVQMQKMLITTYGADMNLRSVMLRAMGRMGAATNEKVRTELAQSLTWSGDPTMLVKAGEGAYLAHFDKKLLEALIDQSTKAASVMMVNFKKRQVKMFFWGKVVKGTCSEGSEYEEKFKKCGMDPPPLPGQKKKDIEDANWNCFHKFKEFWLPEFYYAIKYHKPGDFKNYVQPFCKKTDPWWNKVVPELKKQAMKPGAAGAAAKQQLYACSENPTAKQLKKKETVKCGEWAICDPSNNFLCLDGHWQLRMHFHKHAALLTTPEYVDNLLKHTARDLMAPHGIRTATLPCKEKKLPKCTVASAFYDNDDKLYLNEVPWPENVEKLRQLKAVSILEKELCQHREFLWVVKECGNDLNKYINVVKGVQKVPTEDCAKLKPPYPDKLDSRSQPSARKTPGWRARLKALRMIAIYGGKAGLGSRAVKNAVQAVITYYVQAGQLSVDAMQETRDMILLVLDRIGDYQKQRDVMCPYPYTMRRRSILREKYNIPHYEDKLARAKKDKKEQDIEKWKTRIKKYNDKVKAELVKLTNDQPCYKIMKLVIEDETNRRVKGVWQINRDARNSVGRLARRSKLRYDQI